VRRILLAALFCLGLAVGVAPAGAASLTLDYVRTAPPSSGDARHHEPPTPPTDVYVIRVADEAAEGNRIVVARDGRVRDDGAPLQPGPNCAIGADGWATCRVPVRPGAASLYLYEVAAGAGDDVVRLGWAFHSVVEPPVDLGDGDDVVEVTGGGWVVDGGGGADALSGVSQAPDPSRKGGVGDEVIVYWDGGTGADRVSGSGVKRVTYASRTQGVRVTPDGVADDGEPREGDNVGPEVAIIEGGSGPDELHLPPGRVTDAEVAGGAGDDRLVGGDGVGKLRGGPGDDVITGGRFGDELIGAEGADQLDGGPGPDLLDGGSGPDRIDGGPGDDAASALTDASSDVWRGGEGRDRLSIASSASTTPPVSVTLDDRPDDGTPNEHDDVKGDWESVSIQRGRLVGTDGPDQLTVAGAGVIDGRGGDDQLTGGTTVTGGPGRDVVLDDREAMLGLSAAPRRIDVRDGERDVVSCPRFNPAASVLRDRVDQIRGCFASALIQSVQEQRRLPAGGVLPVRLRCLGFQRCRGRLTIRAFLRGSRPMAVAPFDIAAGATKIVRLSLRRRVASLRVSCGRALLAATTTAPVSVAKDVKTTAIANVGHTARRALPACNGVDVPRA
jgi:hypothetical protein